MHIRVSVCPLSCDDTAFIENNTELSLLIQRDDCSRGGPALKSTYSTY